MPLPLVLNDQTGLLLLLAFILLLIWRPETLPRVMRLLGRAYKWIRDSIRQILNEIEETRTEVREEVDSIVRLARELGIDTIGKSKEEIFNEILRRLEERR